MYFALDMVLTGLMYSFIQLCYVHLLYRWYYGNINRQKAEKLLLSSQNKTGSFLVRISESHSDEYTISGPFPCFFSRRHSLSLPLSSLHFNAWRPPVLPSRISLVSLSHTSSSFFLISRFLSDLHDKVSPLHQSYYFLPKISTLGLSSILSGQHIYIYIYIYTYTYLSLYIYISLSLYIYIYIYIYISVSLSLYIYIYISPSLSLSIYIYIYIYPSLSLSLYIYIYIRLSLSLSICISPSLSLSLSIYIYIYIYISVSLSLYIYISVSLSLSLSLYIYIYIYILVVGRYRR